jgi:glycosyltransferase involved in cell wall biosynthesis
MFMSKNILYIVTQGKWGGAQRYVFDLAINLKSEFDVTVAVGEPNGKQDLQERLKNGAATGGQVPGGIKVVQLKHLVRRVSFINDIWAIFELKKLYKKLKPDIIHLNSSKAGIIGSFATYKLQAISYKLIYTVHGWVFKEPLSWLRRSLYFYLEKITARKKDSIIVLSEAERMVATEELKIPTKKVTTLPLGVDTPKQNITKEEARSQLINKFGVNADENFTWFGTIAGNYKTKGLDLLIESIAAKKEGLTNANFIVIGSGPELENLKLQFTSYELQDRIHFTGNIENAAYLLPAFDFFVLPSRKEGLPYTLLEAQTAGIPCIATNVGGVPEIITNKKTGLLVTAGDTNELAAALLWAMQNKTEMDKFAIAAKNSSSNHYIEKMINLTRELYQSSLKAASG